MLFSARLRKSRKRNMSTQLLLAWTGDIGAPRDELIKKLRSIGVEVTNVISPQTSAICVGRDPKLGKLTEAMHLNVPQVTPEFLHSWLTTGSQPRFSDFSADVFGSRRNSMASSSSSSMHADFTRRSPNSKKRSAHPYEREIATMRPSKRSKNVISRSLSTSSLNSTQGGTHSSSNPLSKKHAQQMHDSSNIRYASSEDPGAVVALEGLIGIGKSTLCNKLLQLYPDEVDVYREETNEKFLQLFYSDPKRYGFALQWGMLKSRIYQLRLAQHDTKHGRWPHRELLFWDRSMIGDYTFALWNHLLGGISKNEMEAYESEFGGSVRQMDKIAFLKDIQLFVLMNDEPSRCKTRVEVNRKNASEQGIPLPYYEGLDDIHFHVFVELLRSKCAKVLIQPWGEYDDAELCKSIYEDAIYGRSALPSIVDEPAGLNLSMLTSSDPSVLIYKNDEEVNTQYKLLSSAHSVAIDALRAYKDVYIPRDILRVDLASKEVVKEHWEPYNIKFYENAYKRVVLFHLGHNQNIHFYDAFPKL